MGKIFSKDELKWLEIIASSKWSKGYRCIKCGNERSFDGRTPFSKKCTICKYEESATANTPFHGLRFSILDAVKILRHLIDVCEQYFSYIEEDPFLKRKSQEENIRLREVQMRASSITLAEKFGMHQKTVFLFLQRFMSHIPHDPHGGYVSTQWFRGVKEENWGYYADMYHLIQKVGTVERMITIAIVGYEDEEEY